MSQSQYAAGAPAGAPSGSLPAPRERCRPLVMGIVNVTPDSFSDGGRWDRAEAALAHALELLEAGADILDIGGESTRPGAQRPSEQEELDRVVPVVEAVLAQRPGTVISVDTMRAVVGAAALDAGATIVNDVSGGLADPELVAASAERSAAYIAMHWRGHSTDMQSRAVYGDVLEDVLRELGERRDALLAQGIRPELLVLDPGLGFAKTGEHNWRLMAHLGRFRELGHPVLLGASRKTFLGQPRPEGPKRPPQDREPETLVTSVVAAQLDLWGVRVHDVAGTVRAVEAVAAMARHA